MITPAYFCMDNFNGGGASPDLPPYIVNPVSDVVFNEYPQTQQVNLNGVATDPDDPDENIVYSIVNNSNPSALTATMSGKILVMTRQNANQATVDLTMRATSDGQYVNFNVHVILNAVIDEPPYVVTPVPDVVMDEFPKLVYIDFNGVATDPDDPDELIEYTMLSNSNEAAVSATMNGRILMLERLTAEQAEAEIAMRATSDGQYVDFNFRVIMNYVEGLEEDTKAMLVYPNPTNGIITVHLDESKRFDYEVYNFKGQCIMNGKVTGNETTLDLGHLNKGVYYISIECNGNRLIKKVVVK